MTNLFRGLEMTSENDLVAIFYPTLLLAFLSIILDNCLILISKNNSNLKTSNVSSLS
jgi:hypothetical protein